MSTSAPISVIQNGLVLCLDAGNTKSYTGSGTTWTDLSRNGNNGTLTNGPAFNSGNNGAIVFDGTDDRVTVTNSIPALNDLTIEIFLYPTVVDSTQNIFFDQYLSLRFEISGSNKFNSHLGNGVSAWYYTSLQSVTTVTINTWYHVVLTRRGTTATFYLNGIAENSLSVSSNATGTGNITLGQHTPDTNYAWAGKMGNVKVYSTALTPSEILQNYNSTKSRFGL